MSSRITPCTSFAIPYTGPNADIVGHLIKESTTLWDYTLTRQLLLDDYQLNHGDLLGMHALAEAATRGKVVIIQSIFDESGPPLLSLGDKFGSIPLHHAVQHFQIEAIKLLLDLGSPLNVTVTESFFVPGSEYLVHSGATPLDTAVKTHKVAIIKLLLKYGGLLNLPVLEQDKPFLTEAQNELAKEKAPLVLTIDLATNQNTFPQTILELITEFAL